MLLYKYVRPERIDIIENEEQENKGVRSPLLTKQFIECDLLSYPIVDLLFFFAQRGTRDTIETIKMLK